MWVVCAGYVGLLVLLVAMENSLVYPRPAFSEVRWNAARERASAREIKQPIRQSEHEAGNWVGWLYEPLESEPTGTAIFFHGNGESLPNRTGFLRRLVEEANLRILAVEYPGYGPASGSPNQQSIEEAALASLHWLCEAHALAPKDVFLVGVSLGGAVAVSLAASTGGRALVLINTFSSLPDTAAETYWFFPVRTVMRNQYPSAKRLATCDIPLLQIHGEDDRIVPIELGKRLFESSPSDSKRFVPLAGVGHNSRLPSQFWNGVIPFLKRG